jgi:RNA polymerase sigma-70 factor (ECF subfamily)
VKHQPPVPPILEDRVRWEALYQAERPRVLRLCRLLLRDAAEAEEVAQEVFLRSFQAFAEGRITAWGPWLTRVAVNACRDRRRSGWWRWWRGAGATTASDAGLPDLAASPERVALGAEARERIWRTFRELSPRQREVVVLRYVEEWSTEEVAEALNLTTGAVKRHLFRAVRRLRSALGEMS